MYKNYFPKNYSGYTFQNQYKEWYNYRKKLNRSQEDLQFLIDQERQLVSKLRQKLEQKDLYISQLEQHLRIQSEQIKKYLQQNQTHQFNMTCLQQKNRNLQQLLIKKNHQINQKNFQIFELEKQLDQISKIVHFRDNSQGSLLSKIEKIMRQQPNLSSQKSQVIDKLQEEKLHLLKLLTQMEESINQNSTTTKSRLSQTPIATISKRN